MSVRVNPPPLKLPAQLSQQKEVSAFFDGLLRTFYQLWNEVFSQNFKEKTLTVGNTVTPLQRIIVPDNTSIFIEARIVARRTGGSAGAEGDTAFYILQGCFKNVSGTISLVSSTILNGGEDQASWNCAFSVSGQQVVIVGTGEVNNNITWQSTVSLYEVGL